MSLGTIAIDATSYGAQKTGSLRRSTEISLQLIRKGWQLVWITRSSFKHPLDPKIRIASLPIDQNFAPLRTWAARKHFAAAFKQFNCNVLLSETPPFLVDAPTIYTVHDLASWDEPRHTSLGRRMWRKWTTPRAIRQAHAINTVSNFSKERISDLFESTKPVVISNGIDHLTPLARTPSATPLFLAIGPEDKLRDWSFLVKAIRNVRKVAGMEESKLIFVSQKEHQDTCDWVSYMSASDEELAELYASATAVICESRYEGFDFPLGEAINANCPVLASDIQVHREVSNNYAQLFSLGDKDKLVFLMKQVFFNGGKPICKTADRQSIIGTYSWNRSGEAMHELILKVLRQAT